MPKKPKPPTTWTNDEALKRLFPKRVRDWLKKLAHERDDAKQPHEVQDSRGLAVRQVHNPADAGPDYERRPAHHYPGTPGAPA